MVQRINFTVERVANFKCEPNKSQSFLRDARTPGLGLRVTKGGSRAYIFEARIADRGSGQKVLRWKIGDAKTMLLKDAQEEARRLKRVTDAGENPRELRQQEMFDLQEIERRRQLQTVPAQVAWEKYLADNWSRWGDRYKADFEEISKVGGERITRGRRSTGSDVSQPGILRPILDLPLAAITRTRIETWVAEEHLKRPTRTRLALSMLSAFLNWCSDYNQEVTNSNGTRTEVYPYRDQINENACRRIKRRLGTPQPRKDALQKEQLALWFSAVQSILNQTQSSYLQCLLLTGARRNELSILKWEDIDFRWKTITIKDKVEGTRAIPLTPYVEKLLIELRRLNPTSIWVFASNLSESGHIEEPRISHNKALKAIGLPSITLHGLRRSFGTLAEWVECPAGISAQIMGHKPSAIAEKHYRQRPIGLLNLWHTKIETWILTEARILATNNN